MLRRLLRGVAHAHQTPCWQTLASAWSLRNSSSLCSADLEAEIERLTSMSKTGVSLKNLVDTGKGLKLPSDAKQLSVDAAADARNLQVATFLHRELPIRFAHRVADLRSLPYGLGSTSSMQTITGWYADSLRDVLNTSCPHDAASELEFARVLQSIYERHADTMVVMARALFELRKLPAVSAMLDELREAQASTAAGGSAPRAKARGRGHLEGRSIGTPFADIDQVHSRLDRFIVSRIGIRVLIGQYLAFHADPAMNALPFRNLSSLVDPVSGPLSPEGGKQAQMTGLIQLAVSPAAVARDAVADAAAVFERQYDMPAPDVILEGCTNGTFPYIPSHLYYILFELIKNSMRATAEHHALHDADSPTGLDPDSDLPPIRIVIGDGEENEDVVIKVADEGGGVPRGDVARMFSYLFTTAAPAFGDGMDGSGAGGPAVDSEQMAHDSGAGSVLCGLGYGLPVARAYARYFGGDLTLISVDGYGVDAYVHLNRLGDHAEPIV